MKPRKATGKSEGGAKRGESAAPKRAKDSASKQARGAKPAAGAKPGATGANGVTALIM